jgi:hypothetical protein
MDRWGGAPAIKLLARMTTDREDSPGKGPYPGHFGVTWLGNMWANVNRSGHGNKFHCTPAPTGLAFTMSTMAESPSMRPSAASSNSWIHADLSR